MSPSILFGTPSVLHKKLPSDIRSLHRRPLSFTTGTEFNVYNDKTSP